MKKWELRFRYIPPDDYMTPLMYIPIESTLVKAETEEKAWEQFLKIVLPGLRDYYQREK